MKTQIKHIESTGENSEQIEGVRVGRIVNIDNNGMVFVDFPGNRRGPVRARITASARRITEPGRDFKGKEVLLAFEGNDPGFPIVIDSFYSLLDEISEEENRTDSFIERPGEALIDGERMLLEAKKEIVLKCGKSSITLTRAGKILIRGAYILSRSSGANKIKGASLELN